MSSFSCPRGCSKPLQKVIQKSVAHIFNQVSCVTFQMSHTILLYDFRKPGINSSCMDHSLVICVSVMGLQWAQIYNCALKSSFFFEM